MKLLVIRFSAMGDVALTVPVLRGVLEANPELELTLVTNKLFKPFFNDIDRLNVFGVKLSEYKGLKGLRRLYRELKTSEDWDAVIDLHSVMRSWVLSGLFRLSGKKVYRIDKGREEKAELVSGDRQKFRELKHTTERYLDVFKQFGLQGEVKSGPVITPSQEAKDQLSNFFTSNGLKKEGKWLGLAPFSVHRQKTWPFNKVEELIAKLNAEEGTQIFLLGGPDESEALKKLAAGYKNCQNMAGLFSLEEEIALMYDLDLMIAMDSFNMHLAALCDTKVISIWGGTHYYAGFGPLNDNVKNIVEVDPAALNCRPCSVFGGKPCHRGDWACLEQIQVEDVLSKL